MKGGYKK